MGLETVEILLETEELFGIRIADDEASEIRTVGEFHELILRKLAMWDSTLCMTASAFYRLRRAIVDVMGVSRRQVHPQTPLAEVIPPGRRRRVWPILSEASGLRMPALRRPAAVTKALSWAGLLVFLAGLILWATGTAPLSISWGCGFIAISLAVVVTRPWAVCPDGTCKTIGDLARAVFDANPAALPRSTGAFDRADTWQSLARLIADQLGLRVEDITPSSRFVEDLNCG